MEAFLSEETGWAGKRLTVFALFSIAVVNYVDRMVLSVLQVPIKAELGLTDTQMGLLLGAAFGIVYSTAALPIGFLADRFNRKRILLVALGVWTVLTGAAGFANSLLTLAFCRAGVALGEAAGSPISNAIIADRFPRSQRSTVVGLLQTALPIGLFVGLAGAGQLNGLIGWRGTLFLIAGVGLLVIPIAALCIVDPPRRHLVERTSAFSMTDLLQLVWHNRTFRFVIVACMLHIFAVQTLLAWNVPFYVRVHNLKLGDASLLLACLSGLGGIVGAFGGGWLASWGAARDPRWLIWAMALGSGFSVPLIALQYLLPTLTGSVIAAAFGAVAMNVYFGPMMAITLGLSSQRGRTLVAAFVVFITNLTGITLGPLFVGLLSDYVAPPPGLQPLQFALALTMIGPAFAVVSLLRASHYGKRDFAEVVEE